MQEVRESAQTAQGTIQTHVQNHEAGIVRRNERALIIRWEFNDYSEDAKSAQRIYAGFEAMAITVGFSLRPAYSEVILNTGHAATAKGLIAAIEDALDDPDISAVDVLWHGHGNEDSNGEGVMYFAPDLSVAKDKGRVLSKDFAAMVRRLNAGDRLACSIPPPVTGRCMRATWSMRGSRWRRGQRR